MLNGIQFRVLHNLGMEQLEFQVSYEYTIQLHQILNVAISVILALNGMGQAVNQNQVQDDEAHDEVDQHDDEVVVEQVEFQLVLMQNLYVKMEFFISNLEIFVLDETLQKRVVLKRKFGEKIS
jgi:hypothetical protein